jgi:hypothetical protein
VEALRERSERLAAACKAETLQACVQRAELMLPLVPAVALQALAAECGTRGVDVLYETDGPDTHDGLEWYSGPMPDSAAERCGLELLRALSARKPGQPEPQPALAHAALQTSPHFKLADIKVTSGVYDDVLSHAERVIDWSGLEGCYASVPQLDAATTGRVRTRVYVDRFGKSWRARTSLLNFKAKSLAVCVSNVIATTTWPRRADDIAALEITLEVVPR